MKTTGTEKLLILLSSLGLTTIIPLIDFPIKFLPYFIIISILLSIILSALLQISWRLRIQRKIEKNVEQEISFITKRSNRYKIFLDHITEGLIVVSDNGLCKYANKAFYSLYGLVENNVINKPLSNILSYDFNNGKKAFECMISKPDGTRNHVLVSMTSITEDESDTLICITDLQEIKNLEKTLQKSQEISSAAFHASKAAIFIIDAESHEILNVNESGCVLTGYKKSELIGNICNLFICPHTKTKCELKDTYEHSFSQEEEIIKKDGSKCFVLRNISIVSIGGKKCLFETIIDISTRKKAEEIIIKTQRLESIGTLASGVAHEFNNINNIMNGIIQWIFVSDTKNEVPTHVKESLITIQQMIERGSTITNDLMTFTSETHDGCEIFDPLDVIEEVLYEINNHLEEFDIQINNKIPENLRVYANLSEIKSVFANLLSNAWQSLINEKEKVISISCKELDDKNIELTIEDTGCGIKEEDLYKVFDPFFSTKGIYAQSGTPQSNFESRGLGLSVCHTILEKHHNGKINITSKIGKGTKVTFTLTKSKEEMEFLNDSPKGNYEKILVIEQDPEIREIFKKILQNNRYVVWTIENCNNALELLETNEVNIVIIDNDIIYKDNKFIDKVKNIKNKPTIIAIASNDIENKKTASLDAVQVIKKPFNLRKILWTIWKTTKKRNGKL